MVDLLELSFLSSHFWSDVTILCMRSATQGCSTGNHTSSPEAGSLFIFQHPSAVYFSLNETLSLDGRGSAVYNHDPSPNQPPKSQV